MYWKMFANTQMLGVGIDFPDVALSPTPVAPTPAAVPQTAAPEPQPTRPTGPQPDAVTPKADDFDIMKLFEHYLF